MSVWKVFSALVVAELTELLDKLAAELTETDIVPGFIAVLDAMFCVTELEIEAREVNLVVCGIVAVDGVLEADCPDVAGFVCMFVDEDIETGTLVEGKVETVCDKVDTTVLGDVFTVIDSVVSRVALSFVCSADVVIDRSVDPDVWLVAGASLELDGTADELRTIVVKVVSEVDCSVNSDVDIELAAIGSLVVVVIVLLLVFIVVSVDSIGLGV